MNIHLLTTDIWFYTTLLLLVGYAILAGFVLYALRKIWPMLKGVKRTRKYSMDITLTPAPESSLRQKLYGNNH